MLVQSASVYSQITDNGLMDALAGGALGQGAIANQIREPDITASSSKQITMEDEDSFEKKEMPSFEDENYGYTGGKNFDHPPQGKFFDQPLSYFGYNFFVDPPTTFAPVKLKNIPMRPDYLIGPDDIIKIILFGTKNSKYDLKVTREGEIYVPEIGPIAVAGLPFKDMKELIKKRVENQITGTQVSITLGSLRSIDIFVLGEAIQPGMYSISALSTLTNAIIKSGGVHVTGSLRNIQLKRKGKVISTLDFYDLLLKGDTSGDARLMQGDVVFIPPVNKTVGVSGEVARPGIYELKEDETLKNLINFAGNLSPKANVISADLMRVKPAINGFDFIPVDLSNSSQESFELQNGDVLGIYPVINNLKNAVLLSGHALQPGFFPWKEGMRIADLIRTPDDLLSMTDLNYLLIKRKEELSQNYTFLQIDLEELFNSNSSDVNISLMDQDEILFLPSILTPKQITTTLVQDRYIEAGNQLLLEDQWTSLTYLRKSLMEEKLTLEEQETVLLNEQGQMMQSSPKIEEGEKDIRRYYEYTIYDYCTLPENVAIMVIEESGFKTKKTIPIEELSKVKRVEDIENLKKDLEKDFFTEQAGYIEGELIRTITNVCRNQLLDPMSEIINRQAGPDDDKSLISVFGNVHFPGAYPLTQGMDVMDAVKAAGGFKDATFDAEVELSRRSLSGKKFFETTTALSMVDEQAMDTRLQEMDIINVKQISSKVKLVQVSGEVYFSGNYPITESQTLGELIRRAGGITENGSIRAAYFQRQALKDAELERLENAKSELRKKILLSSQAGGIGQSSLDSQAITQLTSLVVRESTEVEVLGRLVVDLEGILNGTVEDIILEDGDSLYIPKKKQSISVIGEVFVVNSHLFEKGLGINDYLSLSGGTNAYADEENIYLVKTDGSIISPSQLNSGFFRSDSRRLQPGDTIVVPLQVQPFSGIRATTEITQIIYQMALAAAAVNSF